MYGSFSDSGYCVLAIARERYPMISTMSGQRKTLNHLGAREHLQKPPITNGMKYHVLLLHTWKACSSVVAANATTKMIAATFEGW